MLAAPQEHGTALKGLQAHGCDLSHCRQQGMEAMGIFICYQKRHWDLTPTQRGYDMDVTNVYIYVYMQQYELGVSEYLNMEVTPNYRNFNGENCELTSRFGSAIFSDKPISIIICTFPPFFCMTDG